MCGQADTHDEPRARVSSWPPLRLARLRRERESVVVVSPAAPVISRASATERQPTWTNLCLQHQGAARPRDVDCRAGGAKLRTIRVAMETAATEGRRASASVRQDKIGSPVTLAADASRFATRSPAPDNHSRG